MISKVIYVYSRLYLKCKTEHFYNNIICEASSRQHILAPTSPTCQPIYSGPQATRQSFIQKELTSYSQGLLQFAAERCFCFLTLQRWTQRYRDRGTECAIMKRKRGESGEGERPTPSSVHTSPPQKTGQSSCPLEEHKHRGLGKFSLDIPVLLKSHITC